MKRIYALLMVLAILIIPVACSSIEATKNNAEFYLKSGYANYDKGNFDQAIKDFDRTIELNPDYVEAYYYRNFANYKKMTEAINKWAELAIKAQRNSEDYWKAKYNIFMCNMNLGTEQGYFGILSGFDLLKRGTNGEFDGNKYGYKDKFIRLEKDLKKIKDILEKFIEEEKQKSDKQKNKNDPDK